MKSKETGRKKFTVGLIQLLWAELKTMNLVKVKSLYKVCVGYLTMRYFKRRRNQDSSARKKLLRQEVSYRISC